MIAISDLYAEVRRLLRDEDLATRHWLEDDLKDALRAALHALASNRPQACMKTITLTLEAGAQQRLRYPGALQLLHVLNNVDGAQVRHVARRALDDFSFHWQRQSLSPTVQDYATDTEDPLQFVVYPPVQAGVALVVQAAVIPQNLAVTEQLDLATWYRPVLLYYMLYRLYSKDAEYAADSTLALSYLRRFQALIDEREAVYKTVNVKQAEEERYA